MALASVSQMCFVMVAGFFVAWTPYTFISLWNAYDTSKTQSERERERERERLGAHRASRHKN